MFVLILRKQMSRDWGNQRLIRASALSEDILHGRAEYLGVSERGILHFQAVYIQAFQDVVS